MPTIKRKKKSHKKVMRQRERAKEFKQLSCNSEVKK